MHIRFVNNFKAVRYALSELQLLSAMRYRLRRGQTINPFGVDISLCSGYRERDRLRALWLCGSGEGFTGELQREVCTIA